MKSKKKKKGEKKKDGGKRMVEWEREKKKNTPLLTKDELVFLGLRFQSTLSWGSLGQTASLGGYFGSSDYDSRLHSQA